MYLPSLQVSFNDMGKPETHPIRSWSGMAPALLEWPFGISQTKLAGDRHTLNQRGFARGYGPRPGPECLGAARVELVEHALLADPHGLRLCKGRGRATWRRAHQIDNEVRAMRENRNPVPSTRNHKTYASAPSFFQQPALRFRIVRRRQIMT
jgi:hypothetical protein